MTDERKMLGIIASDLCKLSENKRQQDKQWIHIREFIRLHHKLLSKYELQAPYATADIIEEANNELRKEPGFKPLAVNRIGPKFRGIVHLAALVAEAKVDRILFFEDPEDVETEHAEYYALLRNCNLNGRPMLFNEAAHLWAEHEEGLEPTKPRRIKRVKDEDIPETVVLIAHDGEKDRMARLVLRHHIILHRFPRLLATSGTKVYLEKFLEATLPPEERLRIDEAGRHGHPIRGAKGGDVTIADEIFRVFHKNPGLLKARDGPLYHVLFFINHSEFRAPTLDTRVIIATCANPELRVNLMFNSRAADEWLKRYIDD